MSDESGDGPKKKIGLRQTGLPPAQVFGARAEANERAKNFSEHAEDQHSKIEEYRGEMFRLATEFKRMINDQVLPENKGPIVANLEKENLDKLIRLSSAINQDDTQEEAAGCNALCMILMKCILSQRDNINKLSHSMHKMEMHIRAQEKQAVKDAPTE